MLALTMVSASVSHNFVGSSRFSARVNRIVQPGDVHGRYGRKVELNRLAATDLDGLYSGGCHGVSFLSVVSG